MTHRRRETTADLRSTTTQSLPHQPRMTNPGPRPAPNRGRRRRRRPLRSSAGARRLRLPRRRHPTRHPVPLRFRLPRQGETRGRERRRHVREGVPGEGPGVLRGGARGGVPPRGQPEAGARASDAPRGTRTGRPEARRGKGRNGRGGDDKTVEPLRPLAAGERVRHWLHRHEPPVLDHPWTSSPSRTTSSPCTNPRRCPCTPRDSTARTPSSGCSRRATGPRAALPGAQAGPKRVGVVAHGAQRADGERAEGGAGGGGGGGKGGAVKAVAVKAVTHRPVTHRRGGGSPRRTWPSWTPSDWAGESPRCSTSTGTSGATAAAAATTAVKVRTSRLKGSPTAAFASRCPRLWRTIPPPA